MIQYPNHQLVKFTFCSIVAIIIFVSSRQLFSFLTIHDYFDRSNNILFPFNVDCYRRDRKLLVLLADAYFSKHLGERLAPAALLVSTSSAVLHKFQTKSNLRLFRGRRECRLEPRVSAPRFAYSLRTNSWRTPLTKRCNDTPDLQPRGNFMKKYDEETVVRIERRL